MDDGLAQPPQPAPATSSTSTAATTATTTTATTTTTTATTAKQRQPPPPDGEQRHVDVVTFVRPARSGVSDSDDVFDDRSPLSTTTSKAMASNERAPLLHRPLRANDSNTIDPAGRQLTERTMTDSDREPLLVRGMSSCTDDEVALLGGEQYGAVVGSAAVEAANSAPSGCDLAFWKRVEDARRAVQRGIFPERIQQGSSGSYFVKDTRGRVLGVFKPKNEEPYGQLNPNWLKWFHRVCLPCCFGRSCLVPNQGYLSEAGASLVDHKLGLGVVPPTAVVDLAAPTFHYGRIDRAKARTKERINHTYPDLGRRFGRLGLPPKRGSFQTFVEGYKDATHWLRVWDTQPGRRPSGGALRSFQMQFERMVVLDYITRNTDRGNDNWLIKYEEPDVTDEPLSIGGGGGTSSDQHYPPPPMDPEPDLSMRENADDEVATHPLIDIGDGTKPAVVMPTLPEPVAAYPADEEWTGVTEPKVKIAAIDNGLAFPFKHPDEWRAYPFGWSFLPYAKQQFSEDTIQLVLPKLDNPQFVKELCRDLHLIFKRDKGFDKTIFKRQLSVLRGQIFNLREALRARKSPYDLVLMTPQLIVEVKQKKRNNRRRRRRQRASDGRGANESGDVDEEESTVDYREVSVPQPDAPPATIRTAHRHSTEDTLNNDTDAAATTSAGEGAQSTTEASQASQVWQQAFEQKVQTRGPYFRWW